MMTGMRWRRLLQFRLSTIFWLSIVVTITATIAFRVGLRAGVEQQLARDRQGTVYVRAYPVKDLVLGPGMTKPYFATLMEMIQQINPQKWQEAGGAGEMAAFDTNFTIVIAQDASTHKEIESKLAELRRLQQPTWVNRFAAWLNN